MCGLKCCTDRECGHKEQSSAASEHSPFFDGVGSNMTSKMGPNVATHSLVVVYPLHRHQNGATPLFLIICVHGGLG